MFTQTVEMKWGWTKNSINWHFKNIHKKFFCPFKSMLEALAFWNVLVLLLTHAVEKIEAGRKTISTTTSKTYVRNSSLCTVKCRTFACFSAKKWGRISSVHSASTYASLELWNLHAPLKPAASENLIFIWHNSQKLWSEKSYTRSKLNNIATVAILLSCLRTQNCTH